MIVFKCTHTYTQNYTLFTIIHEKCVEIVHPQYKRKALIHESLMASYMLFDWENT